MNYEVYVIQNSQGKKYIGQTSNLQKRLKSHNINRNTWTKGKGPWYLIYHETLTNRSEAMQREKYFKTGAGRDFITRARSSVG